MSDVMIQSYNDFNDKNNTHKLTQHILTLNEK